VWCGVVWCGMVLCGTVLYSIYQQKQHIVSYVVTTDEMSSISMRSEKR
jgi:hypothetical protein